MIPLVLIAGFLGAGKTRFLTEVIPLLHQRGIRSRVVLNDFEDASIDGSRLAALDALVTPLNGECMCCGSLTELLNTLYAVPADPGSVMLIEANGATETDELLVYLTQEPRLAQFTLPLQLTVIDAGQWQKRWFSNKLETAQTRTATHVLLNWTHKVKSDRLATVETTLHAVNPRATRTTSELFAAVLTELTESVREIPKREMSSTLPVIAPHTHSNGEGHALGALHEHTHPFASVSMALPPVVERKAFERFVHDLPDAVVRGKGRVYFRGAEHKMFVWSKVQGRRAVQLDECPSEGAPRSSALFIGAHLPLDELRQQIEVLRTTSAQGN